MSTVSIEQVNLSEPLVYSITPSYRKESHYIPFTGRCSQCKTRTKIRDDYEKTRSNILKGFCTVCSSPMVVFTKKDDLPPATKPAC